MPTIPDRPEGHPDTWIMVFWYFDKLTMGNNHSHPFRCYDKDEAVTMTKDAQSHGGGGISVLFAVAYPPLGSAQRPVLVNFQ